MTFTSSCLQVAASSILIELGIFEPGCYAKVNKNLIEPVGRMIWLISPSSCPGNKANQEIYYSCATQQTNNCTRVRTFPESHWTNIP